MAHIRYTRLQHYINTIESLNIDFNPFQKKILCTRFKFFEKYWVETHNNSPFIFDSFNYTFVLKKMMLDVDNTLFLDNYFGLTPLQREFAESSTLSPDKEAKELKIWENYEHYDVLNLDNNGLELHVNG